MTSETFYRPIYCSYWFTAEQHFPLSPFSSLDEEVTRLRVKRAWNSEREWHKLKGGIFSFAPFFLSELLFRAQLTTTIAISLSPCCIHYAITPRPSQVIVVAISALILSSSLALFACLSLSHSVLLRIVRHLTGPRHKAKYPVSCRTCCTDTNEKTRGKPVQ